NNLTIIPRIDQYITSIKENKQRCKVTTGTCFYFLRNQRKLTKVDKEAYNKEVIPQKKHMVVFIGELAYIDLTTSTLVDIKYSESPFKLEWLIQILCYYSLLINQPDK